MNVLDFASFHRRVCATLAGTLPIAYRSNFMKTVEQHWSIKRFALAGSLALLVPASAHAYVDLGSGSVLIQAALGAIAVAATGIKVYWSKLTSLFRPGDAGRRRTDEE